MKRVVIPTFLNIYLSISTASKLELIVTRPKSPKNIVRIIFLLHPLEFFRILLSVPLIDWLIQSSIIHVNKRVTQPHPMGSCIAPVLKSHQWANYRFIIGFIVPCLVHTLKHKRSISRIETKSIATILLHLLENVETYRLKCRGW